MKKQRKPVSKKKWILRGVVGGVLFVVFNIALVETTSQSWFCNSCHIMNPFYASWKTGSHAQVHCVECHISPGVDSFVAAKLNGLGQVVDDVLNRTSTKPSASVSAMACMRSGCHTMEKIVAKQSKNADFRFDHEKHYDKEYYGIKITCTTCHSHVMGDDHFEVNTGACITCHMIETDSQDVLVEAGPQSGPGGSTRLIHMRIRENSSTGKVGDDLAAAHGAKPAEAPTEAAPLPQDETHKRPPSDCKSCHDAPRQEFMYRGLKVNHSDFLEYGGQCESCHRGATSAPNAIDDAACLSCHSFGIDKAQPAEEIHRVHNEGEHKIECFSCHGTPRHGPEAQAVKAEEFDCYKCHIDQHNIQRQTYLSTGEIRKAPDGTDLVSPMFMAHVDCTGCHVVPSPLDGEPHNGALVRRAAAQGCNSCHQPGLGDKMIPLWQNATHELYDKASAEFESLASRATAGSEAATTLEEAKRLIDVVRMDGSWGVHNPRYTQDLLEQAREKIAAARKTIAPESGS
ncbi:MAG: NapC/NirT family cytochrome c [Phycisphaerales bacterium]|nr:NapC/NirT family cytochrome c [Phycisphaerales bacterium]